MALKGNILSGLATFESAAKSGSFTEAASYLHLTTGAISQQINLLETQLDLKLFERHSRGIRLTEAGEKLYQVVKYSFADIEKVISELQHRNLQGNEVKVKLTPSFAFKWLIPRLHHFYRLHPNISIQTFADGALVDYQDSNFDLVIDYGQSPHIHRHASLLLAEKLIPVMSPNYLSNNRIAQMNDNNRQTNWQTVTLLHDAMPWPRANKNVEWQYWFEQMGIKAESERGHFFNRTDMAMAAAEAGLGIAMARLALIDEDVKSGRLISPFEPIDAGASYYLIQHNSSFAIECFKQWLYAQVTNDNASQGTDNDGTID